MRSDLCSGVGHVVVPSGSECASPRVVAGGLRAGEAEAIVEGRAVGLCGSRRPANRRDDQDDPEREMTKHGLTLHGSALIEVYVRMRANGRKAASRHKRV
ncbi:MAG: hypothetical protein A49_01690 [Methyloceanibacter sp.]|nr:MAG: hypothetical protein A49_01690 [Methyloceanibacter sp.]